MAKQKNIHAQALGRLGGLKGGPARTAALTPEERSDAARHAINTRWAKHRKRKGKAARPREKSARRVA